MWQIDNSDVPGSPRQRLLEGARFVFTQAGYHDASIRDIAKACQYSQAGMRHYFVSKSELGQEVLRQSMLRLSKAFRNIDDLTIQSRIHHIDDCVQENSRDFLLWSIFIAESSNPDHPLHQACIKTFAEINKLVENAFPEISDSKLFMSIFANLILLRYHLPDINVPELAYQTYLTMTREPQDLGEVPLKELITPNMREHILSIHGDFFSGAVTKAGFTTPPYETAKEKKILDLTLQAYALRSSLRGITNSVAEQMGVSAQSILSKYPSKETLTYAALLKAYDVNLLDKYDFTHPREGLISMLKLANEVNKTPGLTVARVSLEVKGVNPISPFHTFFRDRAETSIAMLDYVFEHLGATGNIHPYLDPKLQGTIILAAWDGIKLYSLYEETKEPDAIRLAKYLNKIIIPELSDAELQELASDL